jgi:hypothetical protein
MLSVSKGIRARMRVVIDQGVFGASASLGFGRSIVAGV